MHTSASMSRMIHLGYAIEEELIEHGMPSDQAQEYRVAVDDAMSGVLEPIPPAKEETIAVARGCRKTAALLYDRVWSPPFYPEPAPSEIGVYGATEIEIWYYIVELLVGRRPDLVSSFVSALNGTRGALLMRPYVPERAVSEALADEWATSVTPIYRDKSDRDRAYATGKYDVIVAALSDIGVPDEGTLTWKQVLDFRRDKESQLNYRHFVHWLDTDMIGKSRQYISDEIQIRLDRYEAALRKHGVETVVGTIETLLDPRFMAATSAVAAALAVTAGVMTAAIAAGVLFVGKGACSVARGVADLASVRKGGSSEIAALYQLK
jgi:hypothetical protein